MVLLCGMIFWGKANFGSQSNYKYLQVQVSWILQNYVGLKCLQFLIFLSRDHDLWPHPLNFDLSLLDINPQLLQESVDDWCIAMWKNIMGYLCLLFTQHPGMKSSQLCIAQEERYVQISLNSHLIVEMQKFLPCKDLKQEPIMRRSVIIALE